MTEPGAENPKRNEEQRSRSTDGRTVGDALFAAAAAAKRTAPVVAPIARRAVEWLIGVAVVVGTLGIILVGTVLISRDYSAREREAAAARAAAAEAQAEAERVPKRRAVLDLLDPGPVPMLCPISGEPIGRQMIDVPIAEVKERISPCPTLEMDCKSKAALYNCTPATTIELAAWDNAFRTAPATQRLAVARRAVVGVDPKPRVDLLNTETGQLSIIDRSDLERALRSNPSYTVATPRQVAAWDGRK